MNRNIQALGKKIETQEEIIKNVGKEQTNALKRLNSVNNKFIDNKFPSYMMIDLIKNKIWIV